MNVEMVKAVDLKRGQLVALRGLVIKVAKHEHVIEVWFQGDDRVTEFLPTNTLKVYRKPVTNNAE